MKKFLAVAIGILIAVGIVVYQNPQMRAWFQRKSEQVMPASATQQTLYRWRDKHGEWQISDKPPAAGIKYETVRYPTNANVIPAEQLTGKKAN
jgi:hypothetical protein